VEDYAASLPECGPMAGKVAAPLAAGNDAGVLTGVYASSACAGLFVAPSAMEDGDAIVGARLHGRALVRAVRALRELRAAVT
jgi:hypothetical protein